MLERSAGRGIFPGNLQSKNSIKIRKKINFFCNTWFQLDEQPLFICTCKQVNKPRRIKPTLEFSTEIISAKHNSSVCSSYFFVFGYDNYDNSDPRVCLRCKLTKKDDYFLSFLSLFLERGLIKFAETMIRLARKQKLYKSLHWRHRRRRRRKEVTEQWGLRIFIFFIGACAKLIGCRRCRS